MLDFYREVIERRVHSGRYQEYIDFHRGDDRAAFTVSNHPLRRGSLKVNLGSASTLELAQQQKRNGWNQETAHRLLLERQTAR
jgi:hypothetical protein